MYCVVALFVLSNRFSKYAMNSSRTVICLIVLAPCARHWRYDALLQAVREQLAEKEALLISVDQRSRDLEARVRATGFRIRIYSYHVGRWAEGRGNYDISKLYRKRCSCGRQHVEPFHFVRPYFDVARSSASYACLTSTKTTVLVPTELPSCLVPKVSSRTCNP